MRFTVRTRWELCDSMFNSRHIFTYGRACRSMRALFVSKSEGEEQYKKKREAIGILLGHFPINWWVERLKWPLLAFCFAICTWKDIRSEEGEGSYWYLAQPFPHAWIRGGDGRATIGLWLDHLPMDGSDVGRDMEAIGILLNHFPMNWRVERLEWRLLAFCFAI